MTTLVRVRSMWLNPDMVLGVWVDEVAYDRTHYWRVTLRCEEGQVWQWKYDAEEDADRMADELAHEINQEPQPWPVRPARIDQPPGTFL